MKIYDEHFFTYINIHINSNKRVVTMNYILLILDTDRFYEYRTHREPYIHTHVEIYFYN